VNLAWTVVIVMAVGWTLVSVLVALAFGGMSRGREVSEADLADVAELVDLASVKSATNLAGLPATATPPRRDDEYRTAV
jgi:hypothetical protein